jgi:hypothetical protein
MKIGNQTQKQTYFFHISFLYNGTEKIKLLSLLKFKVNPMLKKQAIQKISSLVA